MLLVKKSLILTIISLTALSGCSNKQNVSEKSDNEIPKDSKPKVNVLIVVLDAFRADMSSLYGYNKPTTPHMEKWAKRGTSFNRAYSQATTTDSSVWSYFNGQYPYLSDYLNPIRETDTPLPYILKKAGYNTALFSDNPFLSEKMGFTKGVDTFDNRQFKNTPVAFSRDDLSVKKRMDILTKNYQRTGDTSKDLMEEAEKWILENENEPWFCYVHVLRPHNPYYSPEPFLSRFLDLENDIPEGEDPFEYTNLEEVRAVLNDVTSEEPADAQRIKLITKLYEGSIAYSDHLVNELLTDLDNADILDNTIVIIMSDHGESFEDHGKMLHGRTHPYQEQVHIPLIILTPESFSNTLNESDIPVGLVDLVPTLKDMLDLEVPQELHGQSLLPLLKGETTSFRPYTYFQNLDPASVGVLLNNQTLMTSVTPHYDEVLDRVAFDLTTDPGEQVNIYEDSEEFNEIRELAARYIASRVNRLSPTDVVFTDEEIELLESLGYIQ